MGSLHKSGGDRQGNASVPRVGAMMTLIAVGVFLAAGANQHLTDIPLLDSPNLEAASMDERRAYIESLSPAEKFELKQKQERFDRLPPKEKERIRNLHEQINASPDRDQLISAMQRYNAWLITLPASRRAAILSQDTTERLKSIKTAFEDQAMRSIFASSPLQRSDYSAIKRWVNSYVRKNEDGLLAGMPPDFRKRIESLPVQRKFFMLGGALTRDMTRLEKIPESELQFLARQLSPEAKKSLEQAGANRNKVLFNWFRLAGFQMRNAAQQHQPNTQQLRTFFNSLDDGKREQIEQLAPAETRAALTILYQMDQAALRGPALSVQPARPANGIQLAPRPNAGAGRTGRGRSATSRGTSTTRPATDRSNVHDKAPSNTAPRDKPSRDK